MALTENMLEWNKRMEELSKKNKKEDRDMPEERRENKMIYN